MGAYKSGVAYGQNRLFVAWNRIIFPDGKALDIGEMPGSDEDGYGGLSDLVDNHYLRIFGSAILVSGIVAGISLSEDDEDTESVDGEVTNALTESISDQLGEVMVEMLRKNLEIAPTLEIRPGFRFNVVVVKDLTFTGPYKPFDY